ncbi:MAG: hypothetical protein CFE29_03825 [Bradyrhizobiaceae bacterium PARB1]|jgi:hypothetical protein|nr:MAG: hypothetical protein CFE29_03825 [Bradyrhizobiaceae bacterium PARB1]
MVMRLPPRGRSPAPVADKSPEPAMPKQVRGPIMPPRFPVKKPPPTAKRSPLPPRLRGEIKALADAARARWAASQDSD